MEFIGIDIVNGSHSPIRINTYQILKIIAHNIPKAEYEEKQADMI